MQFLAQDAIEVGQEDHSGFLSLCVQDRCKPCLPRRLEMECMQAVHVAMH